METALWFAAIGLPMSAAETDEVAAMLEAQGGRRWRAIVAAESWWGAANALRAAGGDESWWEAEEAERQRLWSIAAERIGEDALLSRMTRLNDSLAAAVRAAAVAAAHRDGMPDTELTRAAGTAALLAVHQWALAVLAGESDRHYFCRKQRLFFAGRWPIGFRDDHYVIF